MQLVKLKVLLEDANNKIQISLFNKLLKANFVIPSNKEINDTLKQGKNTLCYDSKRKFEINRYAKNNNDEIYISYDVKTLNNKLDSNGAFHIRFDNFISNISKNEVKAFCAYLTRKNPLELDRYIVSNIIGPYIGSYCNDATNLLFDRLEEIRNDNFNYTNFIEDYYENKLNQNKKSVKVSNDIQDNKESRYDLIYMFRKEYINFINDLGFKLINDKTWARGSISDDVKIGLIDSNGEYKTFPIRKAICLRFVGNKRKLKRALKKRNYAICDDFNHSYKRYITSRGAQDANPHFYIRIDTLAKK